MKPVEQEDFRDILGNFDLHAMVAVAQDCPLTFAQKDFLDDVLSIKKINSRQAAAIIIAIVVRIT